jgi:3-oxoacyl-[acyl-carrier protein] reductase
VNDPLAALARHPLGAKLLEGLGLPVPPELVRAAGAWDAQPLDGRDVLLAPARGGRAAAALATALGEAGARVHAHAGVRQDGALAAIAFDATGLRAPADLRVLYDVFHGSVRRLAPNGRVLVTAAAPERAGDAIAAAVARGVEGFVRSLAKEIGRTGAHANLLYVEAGAEDRLDTPVRWLCTPRSTYVDGQAVRIAADVRVPRAVPRTRVLDGRLALVTGAARGIGAATAARLAEEGARVLRIDVPAARDALAAAAAERGDLALAVDVAGADAPARIAATLREHGGVDVVVHNAGITRDLTLAKMTAEQWDAVLAVDLDAIVRLDAALLDGGLLRDEGRVVCVSSVVGIAGNFGQTNYATAKSALIGYVAARAREVAARGICVNAVAPGFIETPMTDAIPFFRRELGRRMCSLGQGGVPSDVAELVALLASPGIHGVSGQCVRVCGQAWIGA